MDIKFQPAYVPSIIFVQLVDHKECVLRYPSKDLTRFCIGLTYYNSHPLSAFKLYGFFFYNWLWCIIQFIEKKLMDGHFPQKAQTQLKFTVQMWTMRFNWFSIKELKFNTIPITRFIYLDKIKFLINVCEQFLRMINSLVT